MMTTTMTGTTTDVEPSPDEAADLETWKWIAVVAMAGATLMIGSTVGSDGCTVWSRLALFGGWIALPVVAIASLGVVGVAGRRHSERVMGGVLGLALMAIWIFGIVWSSVGIAIDGQAC